MQLSGTEQSVADAKALGLWTPRSSPLAAHYNRVQRRGKHGLMVRPLASTLGFAVIAASADAITSHLDAAAVQSFTRVKAVAATINGHASELIQGIDALAANALTALGRGGDALRPSDPHFRRVAVAAGLVMAMTGTAIVAGVASAHLLATPRSASAVSLVHRGDDGALRMHAHPATNLRVMAKSALPPVQVVHAAPAMVEERRITVKSHDTLSGIAASYHETLGQIERENPASRLPSRNFDLIYPGNTIIVTPGGRASRPAVVNAASTWTRHVDASRPSPRHRFAASPHHQTAPMAHAYAASAPAVTTAAPTGSVPSLIKDVFGADSAWGLRIAACESGYNPRVVNPNSGTMGVFQFMRSTWAGTPWANTSPWDALNNIRAAQWLKAKFGAGQWQCK